MLCNALGHELLSKFAGDFRDIQGLADFAWFPFVFEHSEDLFIPRHGNILQFLPLSHTSRSLYQIIETL